MEEKEAGGRPKSGAPCWQGGFRSWQQTAGIKFHSRMIQASQGICVFDERLRRRTMSSEWLLNGKSRVIICLRVIFLSFLSTCGATTMAAAAAAHLHYFLSLAALSGHGKLSRETGAHGTIEMKGCQSGETGSGLVESAAGGGASSSAEGAGKR